MWDQNLQISTVCTINILYYNILLGLLLEIGKLLSYIYVGIVIS